MATQRPCEPRIFSKYYIYLLISESSQDVFVVTGVAGELPLEEGDVQNWRVEVDELENENFKSEIIVELWLRPVHL